MSDAITIGHNSKAAGEILAEDPRAIYRDEAMLEVWTAEIEAEIAEHEPDLTTAKGREAIASLAYSIAKRKTPVIKAGGDLTEDWRKRTAAVNAVKGKIEKALDALRDKARDPLNKWEAEDAARREGLMTTILWMEKWNRTPDTTLASIDEVEERANDLVITEATFAELVQRAAIARDALNDRLGAARIAVQKDEADRAELAKLRAEREERERQDAKRREAEDKAADEARVKREAEEQAAARAKAEAQRELDEANAARLKAEKALEDQRRREAEEAEAELIRQKDIDHRGRIMGEVKAALMEHGGIKEDAAKKIVLAITGGSVPHTVIRF